MKTISVLFVAFVSLMLLVAGFSFARAESNINSIFSVDPSSDVAVDISAADIVEAETEIDATRETYSKRTVSTGSGWIVTGEKGALLDIHLVSGYTSDAIVSKGWLKAGNLKLRLESTSNTETEKTFDVTAADGKVAGTLVITRGSTYQTGFAAWSGDLDLKIGSESFDAKVNLAIEEKAIGAGKGKGTASTSPYVGALELAGLSYSLEGNVKDTKNLEFRIKGETGSVGELRLESTDSTNYVGKIKIKGDDIIAGKITATLKREGNVIYGPIKIELDGSAATDLAMMEGYIKVVVSDSDTDSDKNPNSKDRSVDDSQEGKKTDNSGSSSDNSGSNRGFWKRFIDFFGA